MKKSWTVSSELALLANSTSLITAPVGRVHVTIGDKSEYMHKDIPYSRKYWWELNLAIEPKIAIARILADLNLAVQYGIAIRIQ